MSVSVSMFLNINDYSNHLQCGFSRLVVQILHMHGKRKEEGGRGEGRDDDDENGTNERGGKGREKGLRSGERTTGSLGGFGRRCRII